MAARCSKETEWTDAKCDQLRELWASDMTAADIGVKLRVSKNAVAGKAHRLGLPSRPSSIIHTGISHRAVRVRGPTLPGVAVGIASQVAPMPSPRTCQWIEGHRPFTPDMFCGRPVIHGSYCAYHHRRCYIGATKPTNSTFNIPDRALPIP